MIKFKQRKGFKTISTTVSLDAYEIAKKHEISWTRALELGLMIIFNEIDSKKYPLTETLKEYKKMVDKIEILVDKKVDNTS